MGATDRVRIIAVGDDEGPLLLSSHEETTSLVIFSAPLFVERAADDPELQRVAERFFFKAAELIGVSRQRVAVLQVSMSGSLGLVPIDSSPAKEKTSDAAPAPKKKRRRRRRKGKK